jgi:malonyl-CoA decarboxylase
MVANSFNQLLAGFSRRSRSVVGKYVRFIERDNNGLPSARNSLESLVLTLMDFSSEDSGIDIAAKILDTYAQAPQGERVAFWRWLAEHYAPDAERVNSACRAYLETPSAALQGALIGVLESPRRELFRRLNLAPRATSRLVEMRSELLAHLNLYPELSAVDADLCGLLRAWFNGGVLEMRRLTWTSSAEALDRIIRYEAVHAMQGWEDLRSRLDPTDRRCFAFFHPAMPDNPLIFVEVALTTGISDNISAILDPARRRVDPTEARCAVFYSISNCQKGLHGIPFGNLLLRQVTAELSRDLPQLRHFVTLSPAPGLMAYLRTVAGAADATRIDQLQPADLEQLEMPGWWKDVARTKCLRRLVLPHAARYFMEAKLPNGKPLDPVARFHLGNGARLERINWLADKSDYGQRQSAGIMVNYVYDLSKVEENRKAYSQQGVIMTGKPIQRLSKVLESARAKRTALRRYARVSGAHAASMDVSP